MKTFDIWSTEALAQRDRRWEERRGNKKRAERKRKKREEEEDKKFPSSPSF